MADPQPLALKPDSRLSNGAQAWLDDHLNHIKERIIEEARSLTAHSSTGAPPEIDPMTITEAAKQFAPGQQVSTNFMLPPLKYRLLDLISGFTSVCALLTITFGCLGLWADPKNAQSWLDISKIFAGAVVGSAGATATKQLRK